MELLSLQSSPAYEELSNNLDGTLQSLEGDLSITKDPKVAESSTTNHLSNYLITSSKQSLLNCCIPEDYETQFTNGEQCTYYQSMVDTPPIVSSFSHNCNISVRSVPTASLPNLSSSAFGSCANLPSICDSSYLSSLKCTIISPSSPIYSSSSLLFSSATDSSTISVFSKLDSSFSNESTHFSSCLTFDTSQSIPVSPSPTSVSATLAVSSLHSTSDFPYSTTLSDYCSSICSSIFSCASSSSCLPIGSAFFSSLSSLSQISLSESVLTSHEWDVVLCALRIFRSRGVNALCSVTNTGRISHFWPLPSENPCKQVNEKHDNDISQRCCKEENSPTQINSETLASYNQQEIKKKCITTEGLMQSSFNIRPEYLDIHTNSSGKESSNLTCNIDKDILRNLRNFLERRGVFENIEYGQVGKQNVEKVENVYKKVNSTSESIDFFDNKKSFCDSFEYSGKIYNGNELPSVSGCEKCEYFSLSKSVDDLSSLILSQDNPNKICCQYNNSMQALPAASIAGRFSKRLAGIDTDLIELSLSAKKAKSSSCNSASCITSNDFFPVQRTFGFYNRGKLLFGKNNNVNKKSRKQKLAIYKQVNMPYAKNETIETIYEEYRELLSDNLAMKTDGLHYSRPLQLYNYNSNGSFFSMNKRCRESNNLTGRIKDNDHHKKLLSRGGFRYNRQRNLKGLPPASQQPSINNIGTTEEIGGWSGFSYLPFRCSETHYLTSFLNFVQKKQHNNQKLLTADYLKEGQIQDSGICSPQHQESKIRKEMNLKAINDLGKPLSLNKETMLKNLTNVSSNKRIISNDGNICYKANLLDKENSETENEHRTKSHPTEQSYFFGFGMNDAVSAQQCASFLNAMINKIDT